MRQASVALAAFCALALVLRRLWQSRQDVYMSPEYRDNLRTATEGADALEDSLGAPMPRKRERMERGRSKDGAYARTPFGDSAQ